MKRCIREGERQVNSLSRTCFGRSMDNVLLPSSQRATRAGLEILPRYACGATERESERDGEYQVKERGRVRDGLYPIQNP